MAREGQSWVWAEAVRQPTLCSSPTAALTEYHKLDAFFFFFLILGARVNLNIVHMLKE